MLKLIAIVLGLIVVVATCSSGKNQRSGISDETSTKGLSAHEITQRCAAEAGVPTDQPGHRMTAREVAVMSECGERFIRARKNGN